MTLDILSRRLTDIDEAALKALETGAIPECLELGYKRELHLVTKDQRREAAKDVSAMANTVGGRLLYGIDEKTLPDGSKVAGPIFPLTGGSVDDTLANVLATSIHPRPLWTFQRVAVTGGFVLVVDVRPSAADLHMVMGYGVNTYYRRLPGRAIPMTEPEVRETYARVLATRTQLEAREREQMEPEEKRREDADESIFVVPVHVSSSLVNPGDVNALRKDVEAAFPTPEGGLAQEVSFALRTESDGCRTNTSEGQPYVYVAVLKRGLVHWSWEGALEARSPEQEVWNVPTIRLVRRILSALELARRVYERVGYTGPVRVHHVLRARKNFTLDASRSPFPPNRSAPAGRHPSGPVEAYLSQRRYSGIVKDLLDPIFHAEGGPASTWFDHNGSALPRTREQLGPELSALLD